MKLKLKKFGNILSSRPAGKDAWLSAQAYLFDKLGPREKIEVDFSGVSVLGPSWAEEFLSKLKKTYSERVFFLPSNNPSVRASLEMIGL